MQIKKVKITNLFGIEEFEFEGGSVEFKGDNGLGKTSFIDSIKFALTNSSDRDYIIKNGASEGQIFIETDSGLSINRKKRNDKSDYKNVKIGNDVIAKPEGFLKKIFTELQLNPIEFLNKDKKEQNRIILDLIKFDWDIGWIESKFGEIPPGIDYEQNILNILNDIQDEKGHYYQKRQDINRDMRYKQGTIDELSQEIPDNYNFEKWSKYDLGNKYSELEKARQHNNNIDKSQAFKEGFKNKINQIEAEKSIEIQKIENDFVRYNDQISNQIEQLNQKIAALEQDFIKNKDYKEQKLKHIDETFDIKIKQMDHNFKESEEVLLFEKIDTVEIQDEIDFAREMQKYTNNYERILKTKELIQFLMNESEELSKKIEIARSLPGYILENAEIPIEDISVKDGIALIKGLPISNLSTGEKLKLCVDIAANNTDGLKIILIDGTESLSTANKKALFDACKEKGLQIIATTTTDASELEIIYL